MNQPQIEVENLSFAYEDSRQILHDITFHASGSEAIGLVGANGVGKSTLLKLLVGLNLAFSGSIHVNGLPVEKKTLPQIREKTGYVFQDSDSQLFLSTAYGDIGFGPRNCGFCEAEVDARVHHALELIGIDHLRDKQIYKMSGGEKKMVSIATILSMTPDIILMDEPSIALDPRNRRQLIHILNDLPGLKLIASHDLDMILDTCERTILMANGTIVRDGPTADILTDRELLEANGLELPLSYMRHPL